MIFYPHLVWILGLRRIRRFELARLLQITEVAVAHKLSGRTPFEYHERNRISEFLGYRGDWLFETPDPPASARLPRTVPAQAGTACG